MSLDCSLDVSTSGNAVTFTLTVENAGNDAVDLSFSSAQTHDVTVTEGGSEVWRWSDGQMFAQMMQSEELAPGDVASYGATWDDPDPGDYEAVAELATRGEGCSARASFRVRAS
jgi:hypothetical protein